MVYVLRTLEQQGKRFDLTFSFFFTEVAGSQVKIVEYSWQVSLYMLSCTIAYIPSRKVVQQ